MEAYKIEWEDHRGHVRVASGKWARVSKYLDSCGGTTKELFLTPPTPSTSSNPDAGPTPEQVEAFEALRESVVASRQPPSGGEMLSESFPPGIPPGGTLPVRIESAPTSPPATPAASPPTPSEPTTTPSADSWSRIGYGITARIYLEMSKASMPAGHGTVGSLRDALDPLLQELYALFASTTQAPAAPDSEEGKST